MSANGKKILSFLNDNYEFMLRVFNSSKQHNFSIKTDLLVEYCNEYNVNIQRLKEFKIVREHSNSEYSIYYEYRQFFEFLLDDFKPVLDASIKIYKDLIVQYFEQLQEAKNKKDHNKVNELVNMIIYEIDKFSIRVENNTKQLLTETRKLKANEKQDDYLDKVLKANKWIDDYIKPLNDVLDKEHPNSVRIEIERISNYASKQRFEYPVFEIRQQFEILYNRISSINYDILKNSAVISKDLMPLIERIKSQSLILSGAISVIENFRKDKPIKTLNLFDNSRRRRPYAENFREEAIFLLEKEFEKEEYFLNPIDEEQTNMWFFDLETKTQFKQKFVDSLPIDNFFQWCLDNLKTSTDLLFPENYYALTSLLFIDTEFEKDFGIGLKTYFSQERVEIELINEILDLPKIEVKKVENAI